MPQAFRFVFRWWTVAFLVGLLSTTLNAQEEQTPGLARVVSRVRENVSRMHKLLPNLVCREEISQQISDGDKTFESKHYLFSLLAQHHPNDSTNQFIDSRQLISATSNGKAIDAQKYSHPYIGIHGGLTRDLFTYFDAPTTDCYEFSLANGSEANVKNTLAMDVRLGMNVRSANCTHIPEGLTSARVWIDLTAFQVVRIEERSGYSRDFSVPFARSNGTFRSTPVIEYAPVKIHEDEYWLPQRKTVKAVKTKGQYAITWLSQYSDYHKFETSVTIIDAQQVQ